MLSRIVSPLRAMRILTWDLEWDPDTLQLSLAGLYDGQSYQGFLDLDTFLRNVLRPKNSGAYFFAHYGGRFDGVFLLFALRPYMRFLRVEAMTAGSAAVMIRVSSGRHSWHFVDSQFLFKESLATMGRSIGLEKLECSFKAPLRVLKEYNRRDCEILYRVLDRAARTLADLGSSLSYTIASTGMQLFRRRYLSEDIPTSRLMNAELRDGGAYVASRVEPIRTYSARGSHWDINASFPYSMTFPLPGRHVRTNAELGPMCIAKVRINVPPCHLPPLPVRAGGSIYFPTGSWEGWYTTVDIERLERSGGRVDAVYVSHHFEPFTDFASYVRDIYRLREAAIGKDEFLSLFFKKLANSVYGKTSERPDKERIVFLAEGEDPRCPHHGEHDSESGPSCIRYMGVPGMWCVTDHREPQHSHLPIAIWTTSNSRRLLLDYGEATKDLAYWDTDGFFGDYSGESSKKLGGLKHEYDYVDGVFVRPKLYSVLRQIPLSPVVKAKGFPRLTRDQFFQLAEGASIRTRMFAGIRTAMRGEGPSETYRNKALFRVCPVCDAIVDDDGCWAHPASKPSASFRQRPKRHYLPDGSSVPWEYSELLGPWR